MSKRALIIGIAFLMICSALFITFGKSSIARTLREGIEMSLDEDFKIKESLGQVFLMQNDGDSVSVSGNVTVSHMIMPVKGEAETVTDMGEYCMNIKCKKFAGVCAVTDGTVEHCDGESISLRHRDGKKSVYKGVGALCKEGQDVLQGDIIGYAKTDVCFKLYENCISLDPSEYI